MARLRETCPTTGWGLVSRQVCLLENRSACSGAFLRSGFGVPALTLAAIVSLAFALGSFAVGSSLATVQASAFDRHVTGCMGRGEGCAHGEQGSSGTGQGDGGLEFGRHRSSFDGD